MTGKHVSFQDRRSGERRRRVQVAAPFLAQLVRDLSPAVRREPLVPAASRKGAPCGGALHIDLKL